MKKIVLSLVIMLTIFTQAALAADVVILPFTINASSELAYLNKDLPDLIGQRLKAKALSLVPVKEAQSIMQKQKITKLNLNNAITVANAAKANYALYGTFNQVGTSFSIDAKFVDKSQKSEKSIYIERNGLIDLLSAVDELSNRVDSLIKNVDAINEITIRGLNILEPDVILIKLGISKGDKVDLAALNEEIKNIWNMGYFSDVTASIEDTSKGKELIFTVVEKPRIDSVTVQGSDAVKKEDIIAAMNSKTGGVINEKILSEDIERITELYRQKGYYLAEVNYELNTRNDGVSATLVFNVTEGNKLYIKEVRIEGLEGIKRKDLNDYLALKSRSILSWFTGSGVLKQDLLERDSQAIAAFGLGEGYVDIQVSAPEVVYEDDGILIIYRVNEGKRYKLGEIGFTGDLIDSEEYFYKLIKLDDLKKKKGGYFALATLQKDIEELTSYYTDYGYAFANVDVQTKQNPDEAIIDILYTIKSNNKAYIRRVEVEGNTHTRDNVILREVRLADGDLFSGEQLRRTNERLEKTRYFKSVTSELLPTGNPDELDLAIKVEDAPTGSIQVGFGYSSFSKFGVSGSIAEQNLFGKGYSVSLQGYLSTISTSVTANFVNPRIYDTNLGFGLSAYKLIDEWNDFSKDTLGSSINFFYPIGEYSSVGMGYRFEQYKIYNVKANAAPSIADYIGMNTASAVSLNLSRDSTNNSRFPTSGSYTSISSEWAGGGIGGDDNFFKNSLEWSYFFGLNDTNVIHTRLGAGIITKNSKKNIPAFDMFFLGGMNTVRGYSYEDMSPIDKVSGNYVGGNKIAYAGIEYIWQFEKDLGLSVVPFFDIGWQTNDSKRVISSNKPFKSVGLELRWNSPMGDLRFAYGFPLDKKVNGKKSSGRFEFAMGQLF